jgi:hypothetical protein
MSYMTKIDGVADADDALPGMAFFAGTGPYGKTCGDCKFRGLTRQSQKATYNEARQEFVHKSYRTTQCVMFKKLAGMHGTPVKADYPACKYFETKEKKKAAPQSPAICESKND